MHCPVLSSPVINIKQMQQIRVFYLCQKSIRHKVNNLNKSHVTDTVGKIHNFHK